MSTIDRVLQLTKEKGISQAFICGKLGLRRTYLSEVRMGKDSLPDDRLAIIADILDTTPEYLKGETDVKEKTPAEPGERTVSDEDIMFALFNGADDITDEMFEEVKRFAQFIQERERNKPD